MSTARVPIPDVSSYDELFRQLKPFAYRGIIVPTTTFEVTLRHDIAEHKYPDRDGASLEAMGLVPLEFSARIPFRNGIVPGPGETFGVLYPDQWRAFLDACADKSTGILSHPELGTVHVKCTQCRTVWAAEPRDGVDVEASWLETLLPDEDPEAIVTRQSPITTATIAALDLDANIADVPAGTFPASPTFKPSFADAMRSVQAIGDQVSLLEQRAAGKIDALAYRVDQVKQSVDRAAVTTWPLRQDAERMTEALNGLRQNLLKSKRKIGLYTVPKDATLAMIATTLKVDIGDVMSLNPDLIRLPIVITGAVVRYYV